MFIIKIPTSDFLRYLFRCYQTHIQTSTLFIKHNEHFPSSRYEKHYILSQTIPHLQAVFSEQICFQARVEDWERSDGHRSIKNFKIQHQKMTAHGRTQKDLIKKIYILNILHFMIIKTVFRHNSFYKTNISYSTGTVCQRMFIWSDSSVNRNLLLLNLLERPLCR